MIKLTFDAGSLTMRLGGLSAALKDLRPAWTDVHTIFMEFMKKVFAAQGSYGGPQWTPLNPQYAAWKMRNYGARPILQLTGKLYRSFTGPRAAGHIYRTGPGFMETGSSIKYARAHQWGYAPRSLPARPIIREFTREEGERAADAILAYLLKSMRTGRR